jgi:hypothetical protein
MMAHRVVEIAVGAVLLVLAAAPVSQAQSPDITALQGDVAKLKKDLEGVQRELQEIKSLLRERAGAPSNEFRSIVLGIGDGPFKGAPDARVTLVEFTGLSVPVLCTASSGYGSSATRCIHQDGEAEVRGGGVSAGIDPSRRRESGRCAALRLGLREVLGDAFERLFANPKALNPDDLARGACPGARPGLAGS